MDKGIFERVAARFGLPAEAVEDIANTDQRVLVERSLECEAIPNNGTSPQPFRKYPLLSARLAPYGGAPENRYVDYLTEFDPTLLVNAEAEQGIKNHPTYARYKRWAEAGVTPPYISVYETEHGKLQSTNRRRTLVAQELGTPIAGWLGPHNRETNLPLKYGDVLDAIRAELASESSSWESNEQDIARGNKHRSAREMGL